MIWYASLSPVLADGDWGHHSWGWGWVMMVGWWVLVVVGIVAAVRYLPSRGRTPARNRRDAREVLDERFARGEIDREEYLERLAVLEEGA